VGLLSDFFELNRVEVPEHLPPENLVFFRDWFVEILLIKTRIAFFRNSHLLALLFKLLDCPERRPQKLSV